MNKTIFQFLVMTALFFAVWLSLGRIDYVKLLHLDHLGRKTENKLGDVIMKELKQANKEVEKDSVTQILNEIKYKICKPNHFDTADIHLHIIEGSEVNAFTLPGRHIIVYTGLIEHCDSVSEMCGVIAHELGHIELNHVMKRLAGEMGIAVLAAVAGNGNSQIAGTILKELSSKAFERKQESDADAAAIKYMQKAHINPDGLVQMMLKFADMQTDQPTQMEWISSHPDSKKRADALQQLIKPGIIYSRAIDDDEWQYFKDNATANTSDN